MKYRVSLNGKDYEIEVEKGEAQILDVTDTPVAAAPAAAAPAAAAPVAAAPAAAPAAPAGAGDPVKAPMPGTIVKVNVSAGQAVKKGEILIVLEAMKMENEIVAPRDGTVTSVTVAKGSAVKTDDVLATLA